MNYIEFRDAWWALGEEDHEHAAMIRLANTSDNLAFLESVGMQEGDHFYEDPAAGEYWFSIEASGMLYDSYEPLIEKFLGDRCIEWTVEG